jgi:hypothetical protein
MSEGGRRSGRSWVQSARRFCARARLVNGGTARSDTPVGDQLTSASLAGDRRLRISSGGGLLNRKRFLWHGRSCDDERRGTPRRREESMTDAKTNVSTDRRKLIQASAAGAAALFGGFGFNPLIASAMAKEAGRSEKPLKAAFSNAGLQATWSSSGPRSTTWPRRSGISSPSRRSASAP